MGAYTSVRPPCHGSPFPPQQLQRKRMQFGPAVQDEYAIYRTFYYHAPSEVEKIPMSKRAELVGVFLPGLILTTQTGDRREAVFSASAIARRAKGNRQP